MFVVKYEQTILFHFISVQGVVVVDLYVDNRELIQSDFRKYYQRATHSSEYTSHEGLTQIVVFMSTPDVWGGWVVNVCTSL